MSTTKPFSIYLLKEGKDESNALRNKSGLLPNVPAEKLPDGAKLFILDAEPRDPWWKSYFGISKSLKQSLKGAILFIHVENRCFAICMGHVSHYLESDSYEPDFGLIVTLNAVDPNKLKSADSVHIGDARRRRVQIPAASELTAFELNADTDIIRNLYGATKDEYQELFSRVTGASSVRIRLKKEAKELPEICRQLLLIYNSDDYKNVFPNIRSIEQEKRSEVVERLNNELLQLIKEKNEDGKISISIPEIVDYYQGDSFRFSWPKTRKRDGELYENLDVENLYDYLRNKGVELNGISIEALKKAEVWIVDENGNKKKSFSLYKCLICEVELQNAAVDVGDEKTDGNAVYHLVEGVWYKIDREFLAGIELYLDNLFIDNFLPMFDFSGEGKYNETAAREVGGICLDRTSIAPRGESPVEPCDILRFDDGRAQLIHVKRYRSSKELSHLFNQGVNSVQLLVLKDTGAWKKLLEKIKEKGGQEKLNECSTIVEEGKYHVCFAIIMKGSAEAKSRALPIFSRITLYRTMRELETMKIDRSYTYIPMRG